MSVETTIRRLDRALATQETAIKKLEERRRRAVTDLRALRQKVAERQWVEKLRKEGIELDPRVEIVSGPAHPLSEYKPMAEVGRMIAGKRIVEARKKVGLSQAALGKKVGMPQSQISRIERNPGNCTVKTLRKLAKALKVDVATFL